MKDLFLLIRNMMMAMPGIAYVDKDKNQIENYAVKPAVKFPCALTKIQITGCENLGGGVQLCTAIVGIRICFERSYELSSTASATALANALKEYDFEDALYLKFQGFTNESFDPFERKTFGEDTSGTYPFIYATFETSFEDVRAAG